MSRTHETVSEPAPDLAALKRRQQATWASGDFSVVASRIVFQAEHLCETADVQAGWRVLDVATGSGNAAIAAARRGCQVVGIDYVPALLRRARERAATEGLDVQFAVADAENLQFPDASFDAVLSIYGIMFAPDHRRAAAEAARVCRPDGRIALASWTPDGFIGETFRIVSRYIPPAPGLQPPVRWGDEDYLGSLFGDAAASINSRRRTAVFRFLSAEENVDFFRTYYGPTLRAFEALAPAVRESLRDDLVALARRYDRNDGEGPIAITADYLESVIVRA
jgi:SAM-dependent methyltransferase